MSTTSCSYNISRATRQLLKRYKPTDHAPSFKLHLYPSSFRFETQNGAFLLDSPLKDFLHFIREQKIPADLLDVLHEANVPFYEGTLIVEIHDHRPPASSSYATSGSGGNSASAVQGKRDVKYGFAARQAGEAVASGSTLPVDAATQAESYRVVLWPTEETLWADLRNMDAREGKGWSDEEVLEIEARILSLTGPPLCLEADPQATRIANLMLAASAPPAAYLPSSQSVLPHHRNQGSKRGFNSVEAEREEQGRKRRVKIMRLMERGSASQKTDALSGPAHSAGAFVPTFSRMSFIQEWRMGRKPSDDPQQLMMQNALAPPNGNVAPIEGEPAPKKPAAKKKKKASVLADKEQTAEAEDDAASTAAPAKKLSKKARAKLEKEEREREERESVKESNENDKPLQPKPSEPEAAPVKRKAKTKKQRETEAAAAAVAAAATAAQAMTASVAGTATSTPANAATPSVNGDADAKTPASAKKPATKKAARPSTAKPKGKKAQNAAASSNAGSPAAPTPNGATPVMAHQQIPMQQQQQQQPGMPMAPMQGNNGMMQQQQPGVPGSGMMPHNGNMMGAPPPQQANANHNVMLQMQQRLLQQHVANLVPGGMSHFPQMSPQQQSMIIQQATINANAQLGLQPGHNPFAPQQQQQVQHQQQQQQQALLGMNGSPLQQNMGIAQVPMQQQQNQMQQQQQQQHMMQAPHGLQAFQFPGAPPQQQQQGQPNDLALGVGLPMQAQWNGMQ